MTLIPEIRNNACNKTGLCEQSYETNNFCFEDLLEAIPFDICVIKWRVANVVAKFQPTNRFCLVFNKAHQIAFSLETAKAPLFEVFYLIRVNQC